jgi:hypothetical protein
MDPVLSFIDAINTGTSYMVLVFFLVALLVAVIGYTAKRIRSDAKKGAGPGRGMFLGILALAEAALLAYILVLFPETISKTLDANLHSRMAAYVFLSRSAEKGMHWMTAAYVFRWILLYLIFPGIFYAMFKKYRGRHAFFTTLVILTIALFGWWYDHWIGILLISIPIYFVLVYLVSRLSQVVIPTSNPDSKEEREQKFRAFLFYVLGIQYPFWVVKSSASREIEKRIDGDYFSGFAEPGTAWSRSHQVIGISAGIEFDQVEGPGVVFMKTYNRPVAVVDLRTQIRTAEVDTTTKDGVSIKAVVFTSFAIDREDWPKKGWKTDDIKRLPSDIRVNPYLENGLRLDRKIGSFPYSTARVKAALSTAGIHSAYQTEDISIYWDQWVVAQVENAARQVVSQRNLNELWHPVKNGPAVSALDEMAIPIREIVEPRLRQVGINLFGARVVNFAIGKEDKISKQQIESWKAVWTQKIKALESEAQAIYKEEIEKAHAYAKSAILGAIADGIEIARQENPDLPRHVIAVYYIHAIEEYIQRRPEVETKEAKERLETVKNILLNNQ